MNISYLNNLKYLIYIETEYENLMLVSKGVLFGRFSEFLMKVIGT